MVHPIPIRDNCRAVQEFFSVADLAAGLYADWLETDLHREH